LSIIFSEKGEGGTTEAADAEHTPPSFSAIVVADCISFAAAFPFREIHLSFISSLLLFAFKLA